MKTKKPKRIRALRRNICPYNYVTVMAFTDTEPCYILRQSDIRALAEQMTNDYWSLRKDGKGLDEAFLYALRRAGMTPGKGAK